jgi:protoheme IX farnesyltransferase
VASAWWPAGFLALLSASVTLAWAVGGSVSAFFVFLGAFTYGVVYTVWLKRKTSWNIVVGGLAGSFAVLAGAAAVDPNPRRCRSSWQSCSSSDPAAFLEPGRRQAGRHASAGVPMLPVCVPDRA